MSVENQIFVVAVLVAALLSFRHPRSLLWLAAIAADYAISVAWWRSGMPFGGWITLACDAGVCLVIFALGRQKWEMLLYLLFQLSVLVDAIFLGRFWFHMGAENPVEYDIALELINAAAIVLIGGIAAWQDAGLTDSWAFHSWDHFLGFDRPLRHHATKDRKDAA